ncbi:MAG: transglutaminase-like domain-containing protein [Nanoarchaeota archaeon]
MAKKKSMTTIVFFYAAILFMPLFIFPLAFADPNLDPNMFLYKDTEVNLIITNEVKIIPESADYYIDFVMANLSWYPLSDFRQRVESMRTAPLANISKSIEFSWYQPDQGTTTFPLRMEARLITKNSFVEVQRNIPFPIKSLNRELRQYVQPTEIIDITPEIQTLSWELSEGKTDLYDVVFTLADWVNLNIEYNLSTLTADASQKSSWVLENRQGVCDEITSLFISLLRSLGIPAKFTSGMAYTDMNLFRDHWGPHGWAEVYFPDVGWVPFDVTYRELGYLDAGHIKLKESADAKENSMEYYSRGKDIKIESSQLNIIVNVLKKGPLIAPAIDFNAFITYPSVGFGSYNLIEADLQNLQDYYVTADLGLSRTNELELINSEYKRSLLLKPKEKKKVYWIVRVSDQLSASYSYTFPIEIRDIRGAKSKTSFTATRSGLVYDYNDITSLVPKEMQKNVLNIDFSCTISKESYYIDEQLTAHCMLKNLDKKRNTYEVCLELTCQFVTAENGEEQTISVELSDKIAGMNNYAITATTGAVNQLSKTTYVLIEVLNKPELTIDNLTYPEKIGFEEEGVIDFLLQINPESIAQNVSVRLQHKKLNKEWTFQELKDGKEFKILFYGNNLKLSNNEFLITTEYQDEYGKHYTTEQRFRIELKNLTFFQKLVMFVEDLESSVFGGA